MTLNRIRARDSFTGKDFAFVAETLASTPREADALATLMADPAAFVEVLDHAALASRLEASGDLTEVSPAFFLYVMLRRSLREAGIDDRDVADYVAAMLNHFISGANWRTAPGGGLPVDYEIDLQQALQAASPAQRAALYAFGGDRNLFLTGLHSAHLRHRKRRKGAPGVRFYESAGRSHYRSARDCTAPEDPQRDTFDLLAETFPGIRTRLNHLASEYFN
ncbi:MAG: hypothetical protein ACFB21_11350 [Opitutales bacterium]